MAESRYRRVIGLKYDGDTDLAPEIALKGDALDAEEIIKLARQFGIPVLERGEVVRALESFDAGETVPQNLYRAVAVVLAELEKQGPARNR